MEGRKHLVRATRRETLNAGYSGRLSVYPKHFVLGNVIQQRSCYGLYSNSTKETLLSQDKKDFYRKFAILSQ